MKNRYHLLNGDALRQRFPQQIDGEVLVAHEHLVDGDVQSSSLKELFELRARFITTAYDGYSIEEYYKGTVIEFEKIQQIPKESIGFR